MDGMKEFATDEKNAKVLDSSADHHTEEDRTLETDFAKLMDRYE